MKKFYKKIIYLFFILVGLFTTFSAKASLSDYVNIRFGGKGAGGGDSEAPTIPCKGLVGCQSGGGKGYSIFFPDLINYFIQIVVVLAVFALVFSGLMYMTSAGDDNKTKRAKTWIIWSLIGVFISSSSWGIIAFLNNIKF